MLIGSEVKAIANATLFLSYVDSSARRSKMVSLCPVDAVCDFLRI